MCRCEFLHVFICPTLHAWYIWRPKEGWILRNKSCCHVCARSRTLDLCKNIRSSWPLSKLSRYLVLFCVCCFACFCSAGLLSMLAKCSTTELFPQSLHTSLGTGMELATQSMVALTLLTGLPSAGVIACTTWCDIWTLWEPPFKSLVSEGAKTPSKGFTHDELLTSTAG